MVLDLPIEPYRREIVDTIYRPGKNLEDRVTILCGGTGIGKSTGLPVMVLDETDDCLIVTQLTQLASMTIPNRVAELFGCEVGEEVGYHNAVERRDSRRTRCMFQTDGIALMQQLRPRKSRYKTLMIDEVHKFNLNIEFLIGLVRENPDLRIILSSATVDSEELSIHFGGAPVLEIPGKMFDVTVLPPSATNEEDVVRMLLGGAEVVLNFHYGEEPIYTSLPLIERLARDRGIDAIYLPLHSTLSTAQQQRCFVKHGRQVVIGCTDYAESSVTIPGVDAVVDTELYNRMEVHNGAPGLYPTWTSLAQRTQRMGRAGRLKRGAYIGRCPHPDSMREKFVPPEITRSRLDTSILTLKAAGREIRQLPLLHPAPRDAVEFAEKVLVEKKCVTADGRVTELGRKAAALPLTASNACLTLASHELKVLDDGIVVASLLEGGGIRLHRNSSGAARPAPADPRSDLLSELALYRRALELPPEEMEENGISSRAFARVKSIAGLLEKAIARFPSLERGTTGDRDALLKAILVGQIENIHFYNGTDLEAGEFRRGFKAGSQIRCTYGDWVVGEPYDRRVLGDRHFKINRSLSFVSIIDPRWITELFADLVATGEPVTRYDAARDVVTAKSVLRFRGKVLCETLAEISEGDQAAELFASWVAGQVIARVGTSKASVKRHRGWQRNSAPSAQQVPQSELKGALRGMVDRMVSSIRRGRELNLRAGSEVFPVWNHATLAAELLRVFAGAARASDLQSRGAIAIPVIDDEAARKIEMENPKSIQVGTKQNVQVQYDSNGQPVVQVSDWWPLLPDEGVQLPGGRPVAFQIFGAVGPGTDVPSLKQQAARLFSDSR